MRSYYFGVHTFLFTYSCFLYIKINLATQYTPWIICRQCLKEDLPTILRQTAAVRGLRAKKNQNDDEIRRFCSHSSPTITFIVNLSQIHYQQHKYFEKMGDTEHFNPEFSIEILTYSKNLRENMEKPVHVMWSCFIHVHEMSIRQY